MVDSIIEILMLELNSILIVVLTSQIKILLLRVIKSGIIWTGNGRHMWFVMKQLHKKQYSSCNPFESFFQTKTKNIDEILWRRNWSVLSFEGTILTSCYYFDKLIWNFDLLNVDIVTLSYIV